MDYATIVFCVYLLFVATSAITTFLHELGHAIPALIFTKEKVSIYLGTYGDDDKSKKIHVSAKLSLYFLLNPLKWRRGMIRYTPNDRSFEKAIIITLLGPLMSLIIAGVAVWIAFSFNLHGAFKLFTMILAFSAIIDLRNMYPNSTPIILADGSKTYCDGYHLLQLFKTRKENEVYYAAFDHYNAQNYSEAIRLFEQIRPELINPSILLGILNAYTRLGEYNKAKEFYTSFISQPEFVSDSYVLCNVGYTLSLLNEHEEALDFYNRSISFDENNIYSICNRGFTYNLFARYAEALADFNKVLTINPEFSDGYSNRAFTFIKSGKPNEALADINTAIKFNDKNAYAYRNLGIYYMEIGDYDKAIVQLQLAAKIDPRTHLIDEYLKMVSDKLN